MAPHRLIAWLVQQALLSPWPPSVEELVVAWRPALPRLATARRLAGRLRTAFIETPSPRAVAEFLHQDRGLQASLSRRSRVLLLPPPAMLPAPLPLVDVPRTPCRSPGELADLLRVAPRSLDSLIRRLTWRRVRGRPLYTLRLEGRDPARRRLLEVPLPHLKRIQRDIVGQFLQAVPPHAAAHGFRRGRGVGSYVRPHVGRAVVLRMDLLHCFASLHASRVRAVFRALGYPEEVAYLLTVLTTAPAPLERLEPEWRRKLPESLLACLRTRRLPQGAPSSPALANLCLYRLDLRLQGLARSAGAGYTRYADDLAFSGDLDFARGVRRFARHVAATVLDEGLRVNFRKTRWARQGSRQMLAGLVVNQRPNLPRREFDALKAILHNSAVLGPDSQNRDRRPNFRAHLLGRIAAVALHHPERGRKLRVLFDRIAWE